MIRIKREREEKRKEGSDGRNNRAEGKRIEKDIELDSIRKEAASE